MEKLLGGMKSRMEEKEAIVKKARGEYNLSCLKGEVLVRKLGILEGENVHHEEEMHSLRHLLMERIGITELSGNSERLTQLIHKDKERINKFFLEQEVRFVFNIPGVIEALKNEYFLDCFVDPADSQFVPIMCRHSFIKLLKGIVGLRNVCNSEVLAFRFAENERTSTIFFLEFLLHTKNSRRTMRAHRAFQMKFSVTKTL